MFKQLFTIKNNQKQHEITQILSLCRFLSLAITSVFFILSRQPSRLLLKLIIICCISVSGLLLNLLYNRNINKLPVVLLLLFGETLFNSMILIPTGGLGSPYIWYSLNTILISSLVLEKKLYYWINIVVYFVCTTWFSYWLMPNNNTVIEILLKESNLSLCLIIVTFTLQILTTNTKKVQESNRILEETNKKIKDSMNYIMELYQAVHLITTRNDQSNLTGYLLEYTRKITRTDYAFYIQYGNKEHKGHKGQKGNKGNGNKQNMFSIVPDYAVYESIKAWATEKMASLVALKGINFFNINNSNYALSPVYCQYKLHGFLGIRLANNDTTNPDMMDQVKFLSELGSIALEKAELEKVTRNILINEEQNRIANEIHDGVLQKLFSISCSLYNLKTDIGRLSISKAKTEIQLAHDSVKSAMSDLRSTIYGYSWKKKGVNNFVLDINKYLDSIRKSHGIEAGFTITGNHELLTVDHKKAFYRIITEGIGNAINHGNAKKISVSIDIIDNQIIFVLTDDGAGFNLKLLDRINETGMGLKNIYSLTNIIRGAIQVDSSIGAGTIIRITVPLYKNSYEESVV